MRNSTFLNILADSMRDTYPELSEQAQQQAVVEEAKEIVSRPDNA